MQIAAAESAPLLHAPFQDHAVLQRDKPIKVWGQAPPGETLTVSFAGQTIQTHPDGSGRWSVTLPAMRAGGPHSMSVSTQTGASQTIEDVLVGDVWLCSGQSNMVLQVHRALDSRAEIAGSANDSMRLLTIEQASSPTPLASFNAPVQWRKAAPATVPDFSATCLYFARELQKTVDVPMGLINASWGGSKIETWMSRSALRAAGAYHDALDVLELYSTDQAAAYARWGDMWESWWKGRTWKSRTANAKGTEPWSVGPTDKHWRAAPRDLGYWEQWGVRELTDYNGMVWYRTTVRLSAKQASQSAMLSLGRVDEVDQAWINARPVGAAAGPGPERVYRLPAGALKAGDNVIVINVLDTYGSGGLHGPSESRALRLADGESVLLDGAWFYQTPPTNVGSPPRAPWEPVAGLSVIHNAMIAPMADFGVRGVVWYQGESNTDEAARYQDLLTGFMADWRGKFGADLPFLIVQLANYGLPLTTPGESGWASLREAQRLAVARDAHAGLAVAIDIGERTDVHPANKQEVGRRLARAARRVIYGESIAPSGPVPVSARREGAKVVVTFDDVQQRLVAYGAEQPIGFELCGVDQASCHYATAVVHVDRVELQSAEPQTPTRVRFCWADSPICTLYDKSGLPAGPFEMAIE